ncbi:hypothetical protein MMC10_001430 [Thelotrema lepadinum]|nr:hypothetical protein [Thelotrema lepadinum]
MAQLSPISLGSNATVSTCCQRLFQELGASKVTLPGNANYTAVQSSYWSLQEADLSPACIVIPDSAGDVSSVVSLISGIDGCSFAIKGNTHAPAAGFANIQDGITIDMTGLKAVSLNTNRTVASVGGGASWLDVYAYLDPFNVSVAGGRNGLVGVGGLTLGGGISHFAARVGWACDNAVNFELVTAGGSILNANATSNSDLFRALKGGANNFGIVTRFDLAAFTQGELSVSTLAYSTDQINAVFKAFSDIAGAPVFDPYTSLVTGFIFAAASKSWTIGSSAVYTKAVANPPVFRELLAIPSLNKSTKFERLSILANESNTPPLNWLFWTGTYSVSAPLMSQMFDVMNETLYNFNVPEGVTWSIAFEPLPTAITKYGKEKGGNSLGTSPADGNAFIVLISPLWPSSASNEAVAEIARGLGSKINALAQSMGLLHRFEYLNYADSSQDPIASYGAKNVARLRATSGKYDPRGVFQKQVPGGFKL